MAERAKRRTRKKVTEVGDGGRGWRKEERAKEGDESSAEIER